MKLKYYISIALFSIIKLQACNGSSFAIEQNSGQQENNTLFNIKYDGRAEAIKIERSYGSYTPESETYYSFLSPSSTNPSETIFLYPSAQMVAQVAERCSGKTSYQRIQQAVFYLCFCNK